MFKTCKNITLCKKSGLYTQKTPTDPLSYWSRPLCTGRFAQNFFHISQDSNLAIIEPWSIQKGTQKDHFSDLTRTPKKSKIPLCPGANMVKLAHGNIENDIATYLFHS